MGMRNVLAVSIHCAAHTSMHQERVDVLLIVS